MLRRWLSRRIHKLRHPKEGENGGFCDHNHDDEARWRASRHLNACVNHDRFFFLSLPEWKVGAVISSEGGGVGSSDLTYEVKGGFLCPRERKLRAESQQRLGHSPSVV